MRARELGVCPGVFETGALNAITDVNGVRVGHATLIEGPSVRTGVTAVHAHPACPFHERVPAAVHVGNGFGKLIGVTQIQELGELETPILLTGTLSAWRVADALVQWLLEKPEMSEVVSLNPVVGETNDGVLNDIRARAVTAETVRAALDGATAGPVEEGSVGAGTGCLAFSWKGGIGTASRKLSNRYGGYTVGVLVQANFGGVLQVMGAPVGKELGRYAFDDGKPTDDGSGSVMVVVATDAPLSDRNLRRLASRGMMGISRTGSSAANGSGDYIIAFSTAAEVRRCWGASKVMTSELSNTEMSPLFQAAVEATEESVYNALFGATTIRGNGSVGEAIPLDKVRMILSAAGVASQAASNQPRTIRDQDLGRML
jgi:D-aminopeptidase